MARFPNEDACKQYLKDRRWPDGGRPNRPILSGDGTDGAGIHRALSFSRGACPAF
jgi:hypothetical protein